MRILLIVGLCLLLAACQASGTHEGANLFANVFTFEF